MRNYKAKNPRKKKEEEEEKVILLTINTSNKVVSKHMLKGKSRVFIDIERFRWHTPDLPLVEYDVKRHLGVGWQNDFALPSVDKPAFAVYDIRGQVCRFAVESWRSYYQKLCDKDNDIILIDIKELSHYTKGNWKKL